MRHDGSPSVDNICFENEKCLKIKTCMVKLYIEFRCATNCLIRGVANLFYVVMKRGRPSETNQNQSFMSY